MRIADLDKDFADEVERAAELDVLEVAGVVDESAMYRGAVGGAESFLGRLLGLRDCEM